MSKPVSDSPGESLLIAFDRLPRAAAVDIMAVLREMLVWRKSGMATQTAQQSVEAIAKILADNGAEVEAYT